MNPNLPPFIDEILTLFSANNDFLKYGDADHNMKIGELPLGQQGVYVVDSSSEEPDRYTPVEYYTLDFYALHSSSEEAYKYAKVVMDYFHQKANYTTASFVVYFSHSLGRVIDLDRDGQGRKNIRVSVRFITARLIS